MSGSACHRRTLPRLRAGMHGHGNPVQPALRGKSDLPAKKIPRARRRAAPRPCPLLQLLRLTPALQAGRSGIEYFLALSRRQLCAFKIGIAPILNPQVSGNDAILSLKRRNRRSRIPITQIGSGPLQIAAPLLYGSDGRLETRTEVLRPPMQRQPQHQGNGHNSQTSHRHRHDFTPSNIALQNRTAYRPLMVMRSLSFAPCAPARTLETAKLRLWPESSRALAP